MERRQNLRMRARVAVRRKDAVVPWWAWALVAGGVMAAMPSVAQSGGSTSPVPGAQGSVEGTAPSGQVPEVIKPPGSATLPQGNDGSVAPQPRSENPQVGGDGARPIPDTGVIAPPANGANASTPVIRPPVAGSMPVIPPPGSPGGERGVIPK